MSGNFATATDRDWSSDTAAVELRPLKAGQRPEGLGMGMPGMARGDTPGWLGVKECPENLPARS